MRSSSDGGSKKRTNGSSSSPSNSSSDGARRVSISTVNTSAASASISSRRGLGSSACALTKSTAQMTASRSNSRRRAVAKCMATCGENVQSSSRVGSPWCWATASQSHTESLGTSLRRAYLRKLRSRCCSMRA
jgi:hypothetical protein